MFKFVRSLVIVVLLVSSTGVFAAIPEGYYDTAEGKKSEELKTGMFNIIKNHTVLSYGDLWTAFKKTDIRPDGKVWDIYSNITNYTFVTDQDRGSGGSSENEFFNREHSFPKSWFGGDIMPMYTDLFHMYPSDKWVNNQRANLPFGNVQTVTGFSANHYSEWGTSSESGSVLTVFEPADELKGDFARSYFYMVTRYEDKVASWTANSNTQMLGGNSYPAFSNWAKNVLLDWNRRDPVSMKEIARNDSIYKLFQHNRNPYIDFKSLAEYVWGDSVNFSFSPSKYLVASSHYVLDKEEVLSAWVNNGILYVKAFKGNEIEIYDILGRVLFKEFANEYNNCFIINKKQIVVIKAGVKSIKICL